MVKYSLYEAKARLSELVRLCALGMEFTITRAGEPIARLCPLPEEEKQPEPINGTEGPAAPAGR